MSLSVSDLESRFGIVLPERHRSALLDPHDPIHDHKELLALGKGASESILEVNETLRSDDWKEWPEYLVAFATNGCGDFFAYDTRQEPYRVYYIGPIDTAFEAMASCEDEGFVFNSFDDWYAYAVSYDA
jgi:hypothetical protein